ANRADALWLVVPLFLELHHGRIGRDFDFAVDDGALGDRNGARADLAANHGGIADLQLVAHVEASRDFAGDDGLFRLDEAVPGTAGGEIEAAFQLAVAVDFAGNHEVSGAADIADEHGLGADESRGGRTAFQETPLWCTHGGLLSYPWRPMM